MQHQPLKKLVNVPRQYYRACFSLACANPGSSDAAHRVKVWANAMRNDFHDSAEVAMSRISSVAIKRGYAVFLRRGL